MKNVRCPTKTLFFGTPIKHYGMVMSGVQMPKEPKITQMDWRSLGYWPIWKDGKKVWVPKDDKSFDQTREN